MAQKIEEQLMQMVETLMINIGRAYEVENLDILLSHQFYFEICPLIFPQFNIQIIKIGEDDDLTPELKMQTLIQLLGKKLQIDVSRISGTEILKGHFFHMYKILRILHQFSEAFTDENSIYNIKKIKKHSSQPILPNIQQTEVKAHSAKFSPNLINIQNSISARSLRSLENQKISKRPQKSQKQYSQSQENIQKTQLSIQIIQEPAKHSKQRIDKKQTQEKKKKPKKGGAQQNLNTQKEKKTCSKQKKKSLRKNNNPSIKLENKKFKSYLQNYMGNPKPKTKKDRSQMRPKSANRKNIYKDLEEIDNFFKSFSYRLRDQKEKYLRRMQQIVKTEENYRVRTNEKRLKQEIKTMEKRHQQSINKLNQCHSVKRTLLKQESENMKQIIEIRKKQHQKILREQGRKHREQKKKEIHQIKNYIEELNKKALMKLEEGGKFEKMIFDMYKRY